ncbi:hypothetical protein F5J12DRAFT_784821 [Pisolithus orientalis]|uniref:uncharacterized protein n=1 Tax=Pisolithus orientalis TaxID=936130 RepID=UPI0022259A81|nr:uncharacterized protein F5J12DRAFT_784821 [Pisolithus orientalis]KAI5998979.1 hypothetical protein F5J12DRAFT_784821 [Pisolithus orientalis]
MTFKGSKPLRAAKGTKSLALGGGHTKCSPGIIDVEENIPLTMKESEKRSAKEGGDTSLKLTSRKSERVLSQMEQGRPGGSHRKPLALIDDRENAALSRKVRNQGREMQTLNSPMGKVNRVLSEKEKAEMGAAKDKCQP